MRVSNKLPDIQKKVDALESAGIEVNLVHNALASAQGNSRGSTTVQFTEELTGCLVGWGRAVCSVNDNFNKVTGTQIAFRRAVSDFYDTVGHVTAGSILHPGVPR